MPYSCKLGVAGVEYKSVAVIKKESVGADTRVEATNLLNWYRTDLRPFFEQHAPDVLQDLKNDAERLERLLVRPETITVCFLGHSGVGKSTLLNALVAGKDSILPAGGVGPLTALATEVRYSDRPSLRVSYHQRNRLWRLIFALENIEKHTTTSIPQRDTIPLAELEQEERDEIQAQESTQAEEVFSPESNARALIRQAQQIVAGDQFAERPLPYLIDALRFVFGLAAEQLIQPDDAKRLEKAKQAFDLAKSGEAYECHDDNTGKFAQELKDHAAGFLAPIIEHIQVGWPSPLLRDGIILVDLPGVGMAGDIYRKITQHYIKGPARAVILTVDKSGLTADTIHLLSTSGYWQRLIGAVDDPSSDPCNLLVAVTRVDDVATEGWMNLPETAGQPKPRRRDYFAQTVTSFKDRMQQQTANQLGTLESYKNESLQQARNKALATILSGLQIHPLSAPEYRKLLQEDEDNPAFLKSEQETGIPQLSEALSQLAKQQQDITASEIQAVVKRFRDSTLEELRRIQSMYRDRTWERQVEEGLKQELEAFLATKRSERDLRAGSFREFLETTSKTTIKFLVAEARETAEDTVNLFLRTLQDAHWKTLKAAATRGGAFEGKRNINIPEEVASAFQTPMAGVWSTKLLTNVRERTTQYASDQTQLVNELCDWARTRAQTDVQANLLKQQRQRIARRAEQMKQVGKEAVGELRNTVKTKISEAIRKPIDTACKQFVAKGGGTGPGTKRKIIELFEDLARTSTKAAQEPAVRILERNFNIVRAEIKEEFDNWGDPLQETADLILQKRIQQLDQSSEADRKAMIGTIDTLLAGASLATHAPSLPTHA
jgi:hypothetical protein